MVYPPSTVVRMYAIAANGDGFKFLNQEAVAHLVSCEDVAMFVFSMCVRIRIPLYP